MSNKYSFYEDNRKITFRSITESFALQEDNIEQGAILECLTPNFKGKFRVISIKGNRVNVKELSPRQQLQG